MLCSERCTKQQQQKAGNKPTTGMPAIVGMRAAAKGRSVIHERYATNSRARFRGNVARKRDSISSNSLDRRNASSSRVSCGPPNRRSVVCCPFQQVRWWFAAYGPHQYSFFSSSFSNSVAIVILVFLCCIRRIRRKVQLRKSSAFNNPAQNSLPCFWFLFWLSDLLTNNPLDKLSTI
jgi:hypothetical protein